jgi:hypothetical protein
MRLELDAAIYQKLERIPWLERCGEAEAIDVGVAVRLVADLRAAMASFHSER